ncbi:MAG: hypothetical protein M0Z99_00785 [Betaproteobacteria bacterium]|nr:hypothetical protein [Betaproteobacteria bacterium]
MPRAPHKPAPTLPDPSAVAEAHALTVAEDQQAQDIERNMVFEAGQRVGGVNSALFLRACADRVVVEEFDKLSKNKAYRAVQFRDESGNLRRCADLDEFCKLYFGSAYRTVKELSDNYHLVGAELYERAEKLGFKRDDYRSIKALPAGDQEIIKQAIATEDRDQVIDLLQEMAARHASEKAALTAQAKEAEETAEARDQVVKSKEAKITTLEEANHKLKRRIEKMTPDEVGQQLRDEVGQFAFAAEAEILGNLRAGFQALADHADANNCTHENFMSGCLAQIEGALLTVRGEFNVKAKPDADPVPDWIKDTRPTEEIVKEALGPQIADFNARMQAAGK